MGTTHVHADSSWAPPTLTSGERRELAGRWLRSLGVEATPARIAKLAPVVLLHHPSSARGRIANQLVLAGAVPTKDAVERVYAVRRNGTTAPPVPRGDAPASDRAGARPEEAVVQGTPAASAAADGEVRRPAAAAGQRRRSPHGGAEQPVSRYTPAQRAARAAQRARRLARRVEQASAQLATVLDDAAVAEVRAFVAAARAETGEGPIWRHVSEHMGWDRSMGALVYIPALSDAGVLTHTFERGSLDLGPNVRFTGGSDRDDTTRRTTA